MLMFKRILSKIFREFKHGVDVTSPDADELTKSRHPRRAYVILFIRNLFISFSAILFICSFFIDSIYHKLKAIAYFCGAIAYFLELLLLTDCFKKKVHHKEMFMVYCLGPLYILMGLNYISH